MQTQTVSSNDLARAPFDILAKVRAVMAVHFAVAPHDVTPESRMVDDLGADSLDMAELLLVLEEQFDVKISEHDVLQLSTVADVAAFAERLLCKPATRD